MDPPDPTLLIEVLKSICGKLLKIDQGISHRYHTFMLNNGVHGLASETNVLDLYRLMLAESREFVGDHDIETAKPKASFVAPDNSKSEAKKPVDKKRADTKDENTNSIKICNFWKSDNGCRHGGNCKFKHAYISPADNRCFTCGSKGQKAHECSKPKNRILLNQSRVLQCQNKRAI